MADATPTQERAKGKDYKLWFLLTSDGDKPSFLEGQTSHNVNFDNATQTVASLKNESPTSGGDEVLYQARIDGIRDLTGAANFPRLKKATEATTQKALIDRIKYAANTTVTMFCGSTEAVEQTPEGGSVTTVIEFTGFKTDVLIKSVSEDYPNDNEVSASLNYENKGGVPIEIKAKAWSDAITQTVSDK